MSMNRRRFLTLPLAAAIAGLAGCSRKAAWPEGMQPIVWGRDTCVACNMVIGDPRFAGELRGGPQNIVFKFDDPGCIALWLDSKMASYPWMSEPATRIWVADADSPASETRWLDARSARYAAKFSPMGYNFGAVGTPRPGTIDFAAMGAQVVAKLREGRS